MSDVVLALFMVALVVWTACALLCPRRLRAQVLVDDTVIARLEHGRDGVRVLSRSEFGEGLWLVTVESDRIPSGVGACPELVTCDAYGPLPARFKRAIDA